MDGFYAHYTRLGRAFVPSFFFSKAFSAHSFREDGSSQPSHKHIQAHMHEPLRATRLLTASNRSALINLFFFLSLRGAVGLTFMKENLSPKKTTTGTKKQHL